MTEGSGLESGSNHTLTESLDTSSGSGFSDIDSVIEDSECQAILGPIEEDDDFSELLKEYREHVSDELEVNALLE